MDRYAAKNGKICIAEKDIKVYTIVRDGNKSLHNEIVFEPNKIHNLNEDLDIRGMSVKNGFHSYVSLVTALLNLDAVMDADRDEIFDQGKKIVRMTVPKGARFCEGVDDDIISTSIKTNSLRKIS